MNTNTKDPAIIATAIERAGITLLRDRLGNYYTIEPRKGLAYLCAARLIASLISPAEYSTITEEQDNYGTRLTFNF